MTVPLQQRLAKALQFIYRRLDLYHDEMLQLSPKELAFLFLIDEIGECRVKDLAARVNLPLSTVSWTADKMVSNGFLSRKTDPSDRRAINLSLARPGRQALIKHREIFDEVSRVVVANLPESEAQNVVDMIEKVTAFFKQSQHSE